MNNLFKNYNYLGFFNPFIFRGITQNVFESEFNSIIKHSDKKVDTVAIAQILKFGYALGDRTLVKDICKSPWMAKPNDSNNDWVYFSVPDHNEVELDIEIIYKTLFDKLAEELKEYLTDNTDIGFLLTGGMDSRVVACVLSNLLKNKDFNHIKIHSFTWGDPQSRDVVYAKRIANLYNWNWNHLQIEKEQLEENIELSIEHACEFSPIHLHAMPKIKEFTYLDCVIAGSFGDSIGRGEYSGSNVLRIKPLDSTFENTLSLINEKIFESALKNTKSDIKKYHQLFPQDKEYQQLEQDYQLHYMRRMLNPCFNLINNVTPVYQMFSSPDVFGFMWSLNPELRTDDVYFNILKEYSPELLEIPWARTGLPFLNDKGVPDGFEGKTFDYGLLIRTKFMDKIEKVLLNGSLIKSKAISYKRVKKIIELINERPIKESYFFEDKLIWLYSLQLFINRNNLKLEEFNYSFKNNIVLYKEYYLRLFFYKYRKRLKKILK